MPKEASFWRSFSAVAVRPSRSSGAACDGSPVRIVIGGGTKALWPGAMVNAPVSTGFGSGAFGAGGLGGALGSTISGGGAFGVAIAFFSVSSRGSLPPPESDCITAV